MSALYLISQILNYDYVGFPWNTLIKIMRLHFRRCHTYTRTAPVSFVLSVRPFVCTILSARRPLGGVPRHLLLETFATMYGENVTKMLGALHEHVIALRIVARDACSSTVLKTTFGYASVATLLIVLTLLTTTSLAQQYTEFAICCLGNNG